MSIQQNYGNIKPSLNLDFANTKQLDPRITYSRASTGTYYDGKTVAKAEENLLTYSQEFDNSAWVKTGVTVTANITSAPDGNTTADKIVETSATSEHSINNGVASIASTVYTGSVYLKASERTVARVGFANLANGSVWFDLSAGTVGTKQSAVTTATITAVGDGWYRCAVTWTSNGVSNFFTAGPATADNIAAYAGTTGSGVFLWGAQLEQRSFATAYTPTTTAPITNYTPVLQTASAGTPRFDHNPITGESLGLLIEEQRTNLLLRSEEFNNAAWVNNNCGTIANSIVSPDGTLTGDKVIEDTTGAQHVVSANPSPTTSGQVVTASLYAKRGERSQLHIRNGNTGVSSIFNLANGTVTSQGAGQTASISEIGNGWYRCVLTFTSVSGSQQLLIGPVLNGSISYTGDGFSGIYIWGAQLEAGAFATSYIPTVASQVTRAVDSASMTGTNFSSWYNESEGTVYSEFSRDSASVTTRGAWAINSGVTNNAIDYRPNGSDCSVTVFGSTLVNIYPGGGTVGATTKNAFAFRANDFAASTNAGTVQIDTSGVLPTVSQFRIGGLSTTASQVLGGTVKKIAYYPRRLTNTQIQALTS